MEPGCFLQCPVTGPKAIAQTETQQVPSDHQETIFHCEHDQEGCEVSIHGDVQNSAGHGPRHPAAGDPVGSGVLDQKDSRGPF